MGDSPVKKLDLNPSNKENSSESAPAADLELKKPILEPAQSSETTSIEPAVKTLKEREAEEPLLKDNPRRFVLFPIQYHEVRHSTRHALSGFRSIGNNQLLTRLSFI